MVRHSGLSSCGGGHVAELAHEELFYSQKTSLKCNMTCHVLDVLDTVGTCEFES